MHQNETELFFKLSPFTAQIRDKLDEIPATHQLCFAAYCSESMLILYKQIENSMNINNQFDVIKNIVDKLWTAIINVYFNDLNIDETLQFLMDIDIGDEDYSYQQNIAIDVISVVYLSIEACHKDRLNNIARIASVIINVVYRYLENKLFGNSYIANPEQIEKMIQTITSNPLILQVKNELLNIIEYIKQIASIDRTIVDFLQKRARDNKIFHNLFNLM